MEQTKGQKLAKTLNLLVTITFAANIIALLLIPGLLFHDPYNLLKGAGEFVHEVVHPGEDDIVLAKIFGVLCGWVFVWMEPEAFRLGGSLFLLACGLCSAGILRQAHWILNTIQEGNPFQMRNAQAMKRAALFCWGISAAALLRFVWEVRDLRHIAPLFTYNALAVPVFFMGGLLFLVMSALFQQAAELQEDQDLTIWAKRKMSLGELAQKVDITMANLSILKNNKARAVRFSTLAAICKALDCQPGDILEYVDDGEEDEP